MLTSKQRSHLNALAHSKKPIVMVGNKGLTDAVIDETRAALLAHELIKVRMRGAEDMDADTQRLSDETGADLVALVGQVAILYREHPTKPTIKL